MFCKTTSRMIRTLSIVHGTLHSWFICVLSAWLNFLCSIAWPKTIRARKSRHRAGSILYSDYADIMYSKLLRKRRETQQSDHALSAQLVMGGLSYIFLCTAMSAENWSQPRQCRSHTNVRRLPRLWRHKPNPSTGQIQLLLPVSTPIPLYPFNHLHRRNLNSSRGLRFKPRPRTSLLISSLLPIRSSSCRLIMLHSRKCSDLRAQ